MNQHQISNRAKAREGRSREDREDEGAHPDGLRLGVATCEECGAGDTGRGACRLHTHPRPERLPEARGSRRASVAPAATLGA